MFLPFFLAFALGRFGHCSRGPSRHVPPTQTISSLVQPTTFLKQQTTPPSPNPSLSLLQQPFHTAPLNLQVSRYTTCKPTSPYTP